MDKTEIFGTSKERPAAAEKVAAVGKMAAWQKDASDGKDARDAALLVRLVVWERARNTHVVYAYLAEEAEAELRNGAPALMKKPRPLWAVRLADVDNAGFKRGMEMACRHLGSGYYEFCGQTPAPARPSEPSSPSEAL